MSKQDPCRLCIKLRINGELGIASHLVVIGQDWSYVFLADCFGSMLFLDLTKHYNTIEHYLKVLSEMGEGVLVYAEWCHHRAAGFRSYMNFGIMRV